MVGILIVTHGNLGVTLAECAQHILQRELPHLAVMAVDKNDDPDRKLAEARELVRGLDDGSGVLLLSDIFGGTPSNIASRLIEPGRIEAVAGVSLPMLVRSHFGERAFDKVLSYAMMGVGLGGAFGAPVIALAAVTGYPLLALSGSIGAVVAVLALLPPWVLIYLVSGKRGP